jgi:hypothetical protein
VTSLDLLEPTREMRDPATMSRAERRAQKRALRRSTELAKPADLHRAARSINEKILSRYSELERQALDLLPAPSLGGMVIRERTIPEHIQALLLQQENRKSMGISDRELDAIARGDAAIIEHEGKLRVIPVAGGGGPGSGAVYMRNLPAPGSYTINPVLFASKTSKNRKVNPNITHPGVGSSFAFRADATGILARLFLIFEGTYTSGGTQGTPTTQFPWNMAKQVTVSANGINNLIACEGLDLRALTRVRNKDYFIDRESNFTNPALSTAAFQRYIWEIPLAYDDSLIGAVFAQTEETFLNLTVATAAAADLFSANPGAYSAGTWKVVTEFYSIPTVDAQNGRVLVLPDITQLHGIVARDDSFTAAGDVVSPLTRTGGILLRLLQRIDNGSAAANFGSTDFGGATAGGNVTSHRFRYGGNVVPLEVPGYLAKFVNEMDYGDQLIPSIDAPSGLTPAVYAVDDFVVNSPLRDTIHMAGITEAQMINSIASSVTVNAGAKIHTVQEAMVAG